MTDFVLQSSQIINGHQYLFIDSSLRTAGTAENFVFQLPYLITNVKAIEPIYTIFPNNLYTISPVNNALELVVSGIDRLIEITPGIYTIAQLVSALNLQGNVYNIQFQYDNKTLKITITDLTSTPFLIKNTSNITGILGFTAQYNYDNLAVTQISDSVVRINAIYDYIHITTDIVQQYYGTTLRNYLATVPISQITAGTVQQIMFPNVQYTAKKSFFQTINVQLVDKQFNQIDNNNSDFIFAIKIIFF